MIKFKENVLVKKFLGNTGWLLFQTIYTMLLQLVIGSISARYLGVFNYGIIGYGASLIALFTSITQLGLNSIIVNEIVKCREKSGEIIGSALIMRFISAIVSMGAIALLVILIEPGNSQLLTITFLQSIALIFDTYDIFGFWFQSNLQSKYSSIGAIAASTAVGIWRITLLILHSSVEWFAFSTSVQSIVCFFVVCLLFNNNKNFKLHCSIKTMKYMLKKSYHIIFSVIAVTIYLQTDKIMLGKIVGEESVGYYTAAITVANVWMFVPQALIDSARPIILENKDKNDNKYTDRLQLLMLSITLMGLCVGIIFMFLGKYAILILFGKNYFPAIIPMQIIIWSTTFSKLGVLRSSIWLIAEELYPYAKYYAFCGAGFNIILNLFLIPNFHESGAAFATLLTEVASLLLFPLFFKETRSFVPLYFKSFKLLSKLLINIRPRRS